VVKASLILTTSKFPVVLKPAEDDDGHNFVDNYDGSISRTVKDDNGNVFIVEDVEIDHHRQKREREWFLRVF
jgi:hypothetical protein